MAPGSGSASVIARADAITTSLQVLVEWLLSVAFTWILAEPCLILLLTLTPFLAGDLVARACAPRQ